MVSGSSHGALYLVARDQPNVKLVFMEKIGQGVINTTAYHLGQYKPPSPSTKELSRIVMETQSQNFFPVSVYAQYQTCLNPTRLSTSSKIKFISVITYVPVHHISIVPNLQDMSARVLYMSAFV